MAEEDLKMQAEDDRDVYILQDSGKFVVHDLEKAEKATKANAEDSDSDD